ncbi:hypothetical protein [Paenibacillus algorifonticola]|uniref:hypothetical protein n=1 Tax=Paenibacillus algorifonticola TaxID=684063 RepID=UPI00116033BD|nr:hypothetical protein [Paenibacillus algorifonticola]
MMQRSFFEGDRFVADLLHEITAASLQYPNTHSTITTLDPHRHRIPTIRTPIAPAILICYDVGLL